jgi:anti-sigma regulatory factor (Ser/Thr protein kinase)
VTAATHSTTLPPALCCPVCIHYAAWTAPGGVTREFPGVAESAHHARDFVRQALGAGARGTDAADLCVTELVSNAIAYTRSGLPGGAVTITIQAGADGFLIRVRDDGARTCPQLAAESVGLDEHGHGLRLVDVLADEWGSDGGPGGRTVWFRCGGDL